MNTECLSCSRIRMMASIRNGYATPMFFCPLQNLKRTHLMPGPEPKCHDGAGKNTPDKQLNTELKAS